MNRDPPLFDRLSTWGIVAFVVGTAVLIPAALAVARYFGWQLPGSVEAILNQLGIG